MVRKTYITKNIRQAVLDYVGSLKQHGILYDRVILFGSRAKGTARQESDIDICVISRTFGKDYHADLTRLLKAARENQFSMDIVPYHPKDFSDRYDPLAKEIRTNGIVVATS